MTRRTFLAAPAAAAARRRPNIVVILADDMGFSDLGCYGSEIRTPNLDALAGRGLRFTQFYNTARCCPTRASLLTGVYPHQAGIGHMMDDRGLPGYRGELSRATPTLAEVLRPAGYRTYMAGKWHVTLDLKDNHNWPLQRGFDRFYGIVTGASNYFNPSTLTRDNTPVEADASGYYFTDALSRQAASYVEEHQGADPFFLYLAYTAPHWPLHAPEADIARCRGRYDAGWDALRAARHARQMRMGLVDRRWPLTARDPRVKPWTETSDRAWQARRMEVYAAQIEALDRGVGQLVASLKRSNQFDNTLILFLADNGGCAEELGPRVRGPYVRDLTRDGRAVRKGNSPDILPGAEDTYASYGIGWANASNTPFRLYKHWVHEGGIATPCIAHWPAGLRRRGALTHAPAHLVDIMATAADLGGAAPPPVLEGRSLRPVFEGRPPQRDTPLFWEHEGNCAVRDGDWKLVLRHPQTWELYNMAADRTERSDLAAAQPERVRAMVEQYAAWARRTNVQPWAQLPPPKPQS